MSVITFAPAWRNAPCRLSGGKYLLLLALADIANDHGVIHAKLNELAGRAPINPKSASIWLDELKESGLLNEQTSLLEGMRSFTMRSRFLDNRADVPARITPPGAAPLAEDDVDGDGVVCTPVAL